MQNSYKRVSELWQAATDGSGTSVGGGGGGREETTTTVIITAVLYTKKTIK